jgi:hypothetical protein
MPSTLINAIFSPSRHRMRGKETSPYYTDQTLVVKLIEHASPNGKMPTTSEAVKTKFGSK